MNTVKNIHYLKGNIPEKEMEALDQASYQYARYAQIYFKIISYSNDEIIVQVQQFKNTDGKYLSEKELSERTRSLFERFFPEHDLKVRVKPYKHPPVDQVTPEWIQERMSKKRMASKAIRDLTGIHKGNISKWISGSRNMSQPVKTMFYLLLKD